VFEVAGKTFNQIRDDNIRTAKALGITVPPSVWPAPTR
jgi:hypothetical protein